jgi:4'-phosphopantetheinyl transferase
MSVMPTDLAITGCSGQKPSIRELEGETQVWSVRLDARPASMERALSLLSPEEQVKCHEFRLVPLRERYALARAALRTLLAAYLDVAAGRIQLIYGEHGKPFLQDSSSRMQFNLAHSGDLCVLAFTLESDVGVDVERIRPLRDAAAVARRFFSKEECEDLLRAPAAQREQIFFRCWTRKEAFVKAVGAGLYFPLNRFRVSLEDSAALLQVDGSITEAESWGLHDLPTEPGYAAALAVRNRERDVRVFPLLAAGKLLEG